MRLKITNKGATDDIAVRIKDIDVTQVFYGTIKNSVPKEQRGPWFRAGGESVINLETGAIPYTEGDYFVFDYVPVEAELIIK